MQYCALYNAQQKGKTTYIKSMSRYKGHTNVIYRPYTILTGVLLKRFQLKILCCIFKFFHLV